MFAKRFRGQQRLLIKMPAHILNDQQIDYSDNRNCYMCRAVMEQFKLNRNDVYADPELIAVKGELYEICGGMGSASVLKAWHNDNAANNFDAHYIVVPLKKTVPKHWCHYFMRNQTISS